MRVLSTVAPLGVLAVPVSAGSITGHVSISPLRVNVVTFRPHAGRAASLPLPARPPRGLVTDVIVYVEQVPAGVTLPVRAARPQLAQREQAFDRRVVVVPAQGSVTLDLDL
jgi:hypothetical protein